MPHKILVVDDDRVNSAMVKFGLVNKMYDVIEAVDGQEALKQVKAENPDLIVLDIMMPRMNGYEFMTELKSLEGAEGTPVIMLTVNETLEDVFKLEGVKGYFVKPVKMPDLINKIVETIGENPG